jgi:hypothetical protein
VQSRAGGPWPAGNPAARVKACHIIGRMQKKYTEELNRFAALDAEGRPVEVLERITFARTIGKDGRAKGRAKEISRRYDLKTGERLLRVSDTEFEDDETGARVRTRA